ncbi:hypothetical protein E2I00_016155 [Balaenoptera physalus]|uniref:Fibulin-2 n=1 Tax=Balaenoptera physalus TaxID=9770 RepID=A0A643BVT9_BALPH|nr:hypothetical protein E2I00_016155 [Balaenoptera physalus]
MRGRPRGMAPLGEPVSAWLALALALALGPSPSTAVPGQDCTGVECPPLENCIEEALEPGACCATCVQQGCACEGYQYYDCLQGGFVRGRVPAGQSYFVDFGSTECSCPPGGGKISCQFMPCPELPPNCIEAVVVADSCPQCGQRKTQTPTLSIPSPELTLKAFSDGFWGVAVGEGRLGGSAVCTSQLLLTVLAGGCCVMSIAAVNGFLLRPQELVPVTETGLRAKDETRTGTLGPGLRTGSATAFSTFCCLPGNMGPQASSEGSVYHVAVGIPGCESIGSMWPLVTLPVLPPAVSTKDLIETCCAAGQQWAIDNDECLDIPESGAESDVCRTAQKHCCVSYLKEKSCMAGVMGAKEGEACGDEDNDTCGGVSLYKASLPWGGCGLSLQQCCDCCGLGLRVRAEGQSCESNPNLGYPCNHVMLSCCEGEDPLIVPEVRRPPEPEAVPRRVSEAELTSREALSLGTETELPNSLPGDDQDECLLLPGELCQHLCINTVGSYHCACFPGFSLQDDGRTCRPGEGPDSRGRSWGGADLARRAWCSSGGDRGGLRLPPPHTVEPAGAEGPQRWVYNGPCKQVCSVVGDTAMCSCFPGYAIMADGVSCEASEGLTLPADINECVTDLHTCSRGEHCMNTRNPVICGRGYHASQDGTKCVDVNECESGVHRCGEGQVCHNLPGSYRYVNECEAQRCSQECANIYGSYQCYCRQGYQLAEDGHTCTDIDECAQGAGILCTFRCINVPGSYQCACPERGYTMTANGRSCKDLDECALGTHNCSEAETCHNIQGGFRCLRFECPPNYVRVSETPHCQRGRVPRRPLEQNAPARITYYRLNFQTGLLVPAHIFRISPASAGAPWMGSEDPRLDVTKTGISDHIGDFGLNWRCLSVLGPRLGPHLGLLKGRKCERARFWSYFSSSCVSLFPRLLLQMGSRAWSGHPHVAAGVVPSCSSASQWDGGGSFQQAGLSRHTSRATVPPRGCSPTWELYL